MPETITRLATGNTVDLEARTVQAILTTETPVFRYSPANDEYFREVLAITPDALDLRRAEAMSVLDSHDSSSIDSRLGNVVPESVRFEDGKLVGTLQISRSERGDQILRDLEDGQNLAISVGYRIHEYERKPGKKGDYPTYRASKWELLEVSFVGVPADPEARTRSMETTTMKTETTTPEAPAEQNRTDAAIAERNRINAIRAYARNGNVADDSELVSKAIDNGLSVDAFRTNLLEYLVMEQERNASFPVIETRGMQDDTGTSRAMADALARRLTGQAPETREQERYRNVSLMELARQSAEDRGIAIDRYAGPHEVLRSAFNTTSDFPLLLQGIGDRILMSNYETASARLKPLARPAQARDFRIQQVVWLDGAFEQGFENVNEHGEFKYAKLKESGITWGLRTFGRIFSLTRQAVINDDLSAFEGLGRVFSNTIKNLEATALVEQLTNSTFLMSDDKALFHADHNNTAAASALSVPALGEARTVMRQQKDGAGQYIDVEPRFLVVPPQLETVAEQVLASIAAATVGEANPFSGKLQLVVEPRLSAVSETAWYIFASPAAAPVLQIGYLSGQEGPYLETRSGWEVDGVEMKGRLDFAASLVDWRGVVKNDGF
ncbi:prohead protease/major capsid protein fusion protein [Roseibium sp.]|uniref:prohead protease/major capsid protein fusion protein n=1 Tax=Roseibium sp. TaxID=1936156 RepID=UPI00391C76CF